MKTAPLYIRANSQAFLQCMQLIRDRKYATAAIIAKGTGNRKLTQRIQQKIDAHFARTTKAAGCETSRKLKAN